MTDFAALRRMMVDGQVRTADVTDPRLLSAMLSVPRERFVPTEKASLAYLDLDVRVSEPGRPERWLLKHWPWTHTLDRLRIFWYVEFVASVIQKHSVFHWLSTGLVKVIHWIL